MAEDNLFGKRIVDGPSKGALKNALFERNPDNTGRVTFKLEDGTAHAATIHSVGIEDGSGESWIITGSFVPRLRIHGMTAPPPKRFRIYFRTDRRVGRINEISE